MNPRSSVLVSTLCSLSGLRPFRTSRSRVVLSTSDASITGSTMLDRSLPSELLIFNRSCLQSSSTLDSASVSARTRPAHE